MPSSGVNWYFSFKCIYISEETCIFATSRVLKIKIEVQVQQEMFSTAT